MVKGQFLTELEASDPKYTWPIATGAVLLREDYPHITADIDSAWEMEILLDKSRAIGSFAIQQIRMENGKIKLAGSINGGVEKMIGKKILLHLLYGNDCFIMGIEGYLEIHRRNDLPNPWKYEVQAMSWPQYIGKRKERKTFSI